MLLTLSKQSLDSTRDGELVEPMVRHEDREIQCGRRSSGTEGFALDIAEVESAIITHKSDDGIKLLVDETRVVRNYCDGDDGACFAVLMLNLGN